MDRQICYLEDFKKLISQAILSELKIRGYDGDEPSEELNAGGSGFPDWILFCADAAVQAFRTSYTEQRWVFQLLRNTPSALIFT